MGEKVVIASIISVLAILAATVVVAIVMSVGEGEHFSTKSIYNECPDSFGEYENVYSAGGEDGDFLDNPCGYTSKKTGQRVLTFTFEESIGVFFPDDVIYLDEVFCKREDDVIFCAAQLEDGTVLFSTEEGTTEEAKRAFEAFLREI